MRFGLPTVQNHNVKEYKAGAQNWDIEYYNGHIYFGNNDGLLTFNGNFWQTYQTPNETIIRSVCISDSGLIYVGAQNELGYFRTSASGGLTYHNILKDSSPDFDEIWFLEDIDDEIIFGNKQNLFVVKNDSIEQIKGVTDVQYITKINNSIWVKSIGENLKRIYNGKLLDIENTEILTDKKIVDICIGFNDHIIIATSKNGIFLYKNNQVKIWETNCDNFLKEKQISTLSYSVNHGLIVGTYLGGIANINEEGKTILHIDKNKGLHNNTISCSLFDEFGNLWLGLYNGIDEININQPLYKFFPDNELQGSVYDVDKWKGKLFFSTSNGLFYIDEKEYYNPFEVNQFKLIEGTGGQTWATDVINGHLYCHHNTGLFYINHSLKSNRIKSDGSWKFEKLKNGYFAQGHYEGVSIFKTDSQNKLTYSHEVKGISESCRVITFDKYDNLWISHPYKNIFRINFVQNYTKNEIEIYKASSGIKDDLHNYVSNINGHCYTSNKTGVYKFNEKTKKFEQDSMLNKLVKDIKYIRRIKMIDDKLWFITDLSTYSYKIEKNGLSEKFVKSNTLNLSTKENYVGGFEDIFKLSDHTLIIPTQEGAYYYEISETDTYNQNVSIKHISLPELKDSILYHGFGDYPKIELQPSENSLKFSFGLSEPTSKKENVYSTKLEGFENHWSNWHNENTKEYTNLTDGKYRLLIKTKNSRNIESPVSNLDFEINTPWYKSLIAICLYILSFLTFLLAIIYIPKKKYDQTTARLEDENQTKEEQLAFKNKKRFK